MTKQFKYRTAMVLAKTNEAFDLAARAGDHEAMRTIASIRRELLDEFLTAVPEQTRLYELAHSINETGADLAERAGDRWTHYGPEL